MAHVTRSARRFWAGGLAVALAASLTACQAGWLSEGTPKAEEEGLPLASRDPLEAARRLEHYTALVAERGYSYTVGDNPAIHRDLADLTGLVAAPENLPLPKPVDFELDAPVRYDSRDVGIGLPPIRDQGTCGSCWAHATLGVLEVGIAIYDELHVDLSEQWLVDCNPYGYGCGGGYEPFDLLMDPGAVMEEQYPYVGQDGACRSGLTYPYSIRSYGHVGDDRESIKAAIYNYGAVAVALNACGSLMGYTGGVYDSTECNYGELNHAVILVGYDDEVAHNMGQGVWIMRNSWSAGWGEGGYMQIAYGAARIAEEAWYVVYGNAPDPDPGVLPDDGTDPSPDPEPDPWDPEPDPWDPEPDPWDPEPDPWDPDPTALCDDSCWYAGDGECDDCGEGAWYCLCDYGTDCWDCGPRSYDDGGWEPEPDIYEACDDTCGWAYDGECDDCGPGAWYCACPLGSDCYDCGPRVMY